MTMFLYLFADLGDFSCQTLNLSVVISIIKRKRTESVLRLFLTKPKSLWRLQKVCRKLYAYRKLKKRFVKVVEAIEGYEFFFWKERNLSAWVPLFFHLCFLLFFVFWSLGACGTLLFCVYWESFAIWGLVPSGSHKNCLWYWFTWEHVSVVCSPVHFDLRKVVECQWVLAGARKHVFAMIPVGQSSCLSGDQWTQQWQENALGLCAIGAR